MASTTFEFESMDFEIAPGVWVPEAVSGTADVECHENDTSDWWVTDIKLDVCGSFKPKQIIEHTPLFAALEKALHRFDSDCGAVSDELTDAYWDDDESRHDPEPNYSPIQI